MSRQLIDGLIILAVVVLGATHLSAQALSRKVARPNYPAGITAIAERGARGPNGGAAISARTVAVPRAADGSVHRARARSASNSVYDGTATSPARNPLECGSLLPLCDHS